MKVGILYNYVDNVSKGLDSDKISDNEIIETVEHITNSLKEEHEVIPIRISRDFLSTFDPNSLDIIFNLCEGFEGDSSGEPKVASFLELMQIPYTGNNSYTLELCLDKSKTKQVLISNNIPTAKFYLFDKNHIKEKRFPKHRLKFPVIVKPSREDASVGITNESIVYNDEELKKRVEYVISLYKQPALVEEFIDGKEIYVPIIGNGENCEILPFREICFLNNAKIFTFNSKWNPESEEYNNTDTKAPIGLSEKEIRKIKKVALKTYRVANCRDYARIDFRLKDGKPYVLEVNPNPTLNKSPCFYGSAKDAGMEYKDLIHKIFNYAVIRNGFRDKKEDKFEYSENLIFNKVQLSDIPILKEWFNDESISKFLDNPEEKCTEQGLYEYFFSINNSEYNLIITDKESGEKIGYAAIYDITSNSAEISFLIGNKEFLRKGYGTKIIESIISIAKSILKLDYLTASVVTENIPSIKSLERNGFERTGMKYGSHILSNKIYDEITFTKKLN